MGTSRTADAKSINLIVILDFKTGMVKIWIYGRPFIGGEFSMPTDTVPSDMTAAIAQVPQGHFLLVDVLTVLPPDHGQI
jgi:hypothetical protein